MVWIATEAGIAHMEVDNDDFFVTAPDEVTLEVLSRPLANTWKIVIKKLTPETPLKTTIHAIPKKNHQRQFCDGGDPVDMPHNSELDSAHVDTPTESRSRDLHAETPLASHEQASKVRPTHEASSATLGDNT